MATTFEFENFIAGYLDKNNIHLTYKDSRDLHLSEYSKLFEIFLKGAIAYSEVVKTIKVSNTVQFKKGAIIEATKVIKDKVKGYEKCLVPTAEDLFDILNDNRIVKEIQ